MNIWTSINVARTPPLGCFKVNLNESHIHSFNKSNCGDIFRDSDGRFIKGFYNNQTFRFGYQVKGFDLDGTLDLPIGYQVNL